MDIYIFSSGRAKRQITWGELPPSIQARTKIVVPWDERADYDEYPVLTDKAIVRNVTAARQWVMDRTKHTIFMLDDDLSFAIRRTDEPSKFRNCTMGDLEALFKDAETQLTKYAHIGVAGREGANRNTEDYVFNTRVVRALGFDVRKMRQLGIRIDRLLFMSDFDVTLQFLRAGYPNCLINYLVQNQAGSNAAGGCSQYRTTATQVADAVKLNSLHPDFVKLVTKETRSGVKGWAERTDVRVYWKKALNSACAK